MTKDSKFFRILSKSHEDFDNIFLIGLKKFQSKIVSNQHFEIPALEISISMSTGEVFIIIDPKSVYCNFISDKNSTFKLYNAND